MNPLLPIVVFTCMFPAPKTEEIDNPFRHTKVGDWAEYELSAQPGVSGTLRMEIIGKTETEATRRSFSEINGQKFPAADQKINLLKPYVYDPSGILQLPNGTLVIEWDTQGKEKVKVGGIEYEAVWTKHLYKSKTGAVTIETEMKTWFAKKAPFDGMIKSEAITKVGGNDVKIHIDLKSWGRK